MRTNVKVLGLVVALAAIWLWAMVAQAQNPPMTPQELAKYARGLKAEPTLQEILDLLGYDYINVATDESGIELFPVIEGGYYQILYAEEAGWGPFTSSGWYPKGTPADTHIVFTGDNVPGDTAVFTITGCDTFGLYLNPENQSYIWYTESGLNSDCWDHSWIFRTHDPRKFIVGWEDQTQSQSDADYQDLVVLLRQPNQAPVITCPGAQTVDENSPLSFVVCATDVEGDSITLRAEDLPSGASFPTVTDSGSVCGTFNWTPDFCQKGVYTVRFIATDNYDGGKCTPPPLADTCHVVITVNDVNQKPQITDPGAQSVDEGQTLSFQLTGTDPDVCDGDQVHIYSNDLPPGATLTGCWGNPITKTFTWTPDFCQAGVYYVHFIAVDNHTLSPVKKDTVLVVITVNDVDRPPEITDPGPQSVDEGQYLAFDVTGSDPDICEGDTDKVELIAEDLPSGATFSDGTGNPVTGTFEWTPNFCQAGSYTVRFIARNNPAPVPADTVEVLITVNDVNQFPVVTLSDSSWTVNEGEELTFDVQGTDPDTCDGDLVTLSVLDLPSGPDFTDGTGNPITGTFTWTPNYGQAGVYVLTFIGTDDHTASPPLADSVEVTITVNDVNQAPVIVDPGRQETYEGVFLTFDVTAFDPDTLDGDEVILSAVNLPEGATCPPDTGNPVTVAFEWTPNFCQADSYTVTFRANDIHTKLLTELDVTIIVHDVNQAPVVTLSDSSWTVDEWVELSFDVQGIDADTCDGDQVTLSVLGLPDGANFTDGTGNPVTGTFTWTPDYCQAGVYVLTFIGTDDHTASPPLADSVEVTITVNNTAGEIKLTEPVNADNPDYSINPGADIEVCIVLDCMPEDIGGYNFLLHFDSSVLTLLDVEQQPYIVDQEAYELEYFYWNTYQVEDGDKLRIMGIANKPNQNYTPPIPMEEDTIICLTFHVSAKWDCNYWLTIDWEVDDACVDNTLSDELGEDLYVAKMVETWMFTNGEEPMYVLEEGVDWDYCLTTYCHTIDTLFGSLVYTGTKVECQHIYGPYGDVNMDRVRYTIADAVYFMEYLKGVVELSDPDYQGTASDVNIDGHQWTIADLIYLVNIVNGSGEEPGEGGAKVVAKGLNLTVKGNTVSVDKPIAGLYLVVKGGGEPVLKASGMEMETGLVNGERRIIIIGADWQNETVTAVGDLVTVPGEFEMREVQISDAVGWLMATKLVLIPTQFALHQNYPNPFNPTTKISFDLPEDVDVSLTIYNISGQKMAELVRGEVKAGKHTITWNATDVSSGVYFYRITAGNFTATKKMVLMK